MPYQSTIQAADANNSGGGIWVFAAARAGCNDGNGSASSAIAGAKPGLDLCMATTCSQPAAPTVRKRTGAISLRRADSLDDVEALEAAWRGMGSKVAHPTGDFIWTRSCLSAFGQQSE